MRFLPLLFFFSFFSFVGQAQNDWCGADEQLQEYLDASPENRANYEQQQEQLLQLTKQLKNDKTGNPIIIPVVVHVMYDGPNGNISKAQIQNGLDILNDDLKKLNADTSQIRTIFQPYLGELNVEFRLARIDPNGNCTEGITRTYTKETNDARDNIKPIKRWPYSSYFNVWLVNSIASGGSFGTVLGYAQFPGTGTKNNFGIVVRHDQWGNIGTAQGSGGRTVTHEVGHCLNLYHTFQGSCGSTCQNSGDYVCDTPPAQSSTFGCNLNNNTCHNDAMGFSPYNNTTPDMLENFMSYDDCQYMFTDGQAVRVAATFNANYDELKDLSTLANLLATGTDDNYVPQVCAPIAVVGRNDIYRCVGSNITFSENSYNADVTAWNWSFPGGTPSSSTDSMPVVYYNNPGVYDYTLIVSSSGGSDTLVKQNTIIISDTVAEYLGLNYVESFENATNFSDDWIITNGGGLSSWQHNASFASSGTSSVWINNYIESNKGEKDALISPSYNLNSVLNPILKFDVAYRKKDNTSSDNLRLYYSTNCGKDWSLFYIAYPNSLQGTNANQSFWYTPQGAADWVEISIPLQTQSHIKSQENIKFKFEFTSGGGNNLYFDNFRIVGPANGSVGIEEAEKSHSVQLFPNPTSSNFTVMLNLKENSEVQIELKNLLGETVKTISNTNFAPDTYRFHVETDDLASGLYLVNVKVGKEYITKKLVIQ